MGVSAESRDAASSRASGIPSSLVQIRHAACRSSPPNLVDGRTTKADVMAIMGDPDQTDEAARVIMYYWTVREKDSENIARSFVIAQFDEKDVLTRHKQADYAAEFGGPKLPVAWLEKP